MPFPLLAAAGIGAGVGALGKLFDHAPKRKKYTIADITGYDPYDETEEISNINRLTDANLGRRRQNEGQKAAKYGFEPIVPNYSRESDIYEAQMQGIAGVKQRAAAERNRIAELLFQLNAGDDYEGDNAGDYLDSAIGGAAWGLNFGNALGHG